MLARVAMAVAALAVAAFMALEIAPARHLARARQLVAKAQAGRLSPAARERLVRQLDDAASLRPGSDALQYAAGFELLAGHRQAALRYARRGARREPRNTSALIVYGYAQARAGDVPGAERTFERVQRLNPRFRKPRLRPR